MSRGSSCHPATSVITCCRQIQDGLTFWYWLTWVVLKLAVKTSVVAKYNYWIACIRDILVFDEFVDH